MPDASTLAAAYSYTRQLTAQAGRTYYLASMALPQPARRGVYALYGFARMVDDIVDGPGCGPDTAAQLDAIEAHLADSLAGGVPEDLDRDEFLILTALRDTVTTYDINPATFGAFLRSMRMDAPGTVEYRTRYRTFAELGRYTYGSAAVIGRQLLPLLGVSATARDFAETAAGAELLGEAFQLTNFLRDIAEDLDRDRIYLPLDELAVFGVDEDSLRADNRRRRSSPPLRRAINHLIAVNRDQYRRTQPAIAALPTRTRPAIAAAARSYADILTEIERGDVDPLARRAVVPTRRRLRHVAAAVTGVAAGPRRLDRAR